MSPRPPKSQSYPGLLKPVPTYAFLAFFLLPQTPLDLQASWLFLPPLVLTLCFFLPTLGTWTP